MYLINWAPQMDGGHGAQVLSGVSIDDGSVRWRVVRGTAHIPPPLASLDPRAPGLISVTTSNYSGGTSQDKLDPATGRVRWQVVSPYQAVATAAGIVTAAGPRQITLRDALTGQARWTAKLTGRWLSLATIPGTVFGTTSASSAGSLLVVPTAGSDGSDLLAAFRTSDGHRTWQITVPGRLTAPPSAVPGLLIHTVYGVPRPMRPTILARLNPGPFGTRSPDKSFDSPSRSIVVGGQRTAFHE